MVDITWIIETILPLIILTPLSAVLLFASTKIFKTKDQRYLTALKVAATVYASFLVLGAILAFTPLALIYIFDITLARYVLFILLAVLAWFLVKKWYDVDTPSSLKIFAVWYALDIILNWAFGYAYPFLVMLLY